MAESMKFLYFVESNVWFSFCAIHEVLLIHPSFGLQCLVGILGVFFELVRKPEARLRVSISYCFRHYFRETRRDPRVSAYVFWLFNCNLWEDWVRYMQLRVQDSVVCKILFIEVTRTTVEFDLGFLWFHLEQWIVYIQCVYFRFTAIHYLLNCWFE